MRLKPQFAVMHFQRKRAFKASGTFAFTSRGIRGETSGVTSEASSRGGQQEHVHRGCDDQEAPDRGDDPGGDDGHDSDAGEAEDRDRARTLHGARHIRGYLSGGCATPGSPSLSKARALHCG